MSPRAPGQRAARQVPEDRPVQWPTEAELEEMLLGSSSATATDGCQVEPDGSCPHGFPSWPVYFGLI